jgi:methyl-accepting chemotaxis protein
MFNKFCSSISARLSLGYVVILFLIISAIAIGALFNMKQLADLSGHEVLTRSFLSFQASIEAEIRGAEALAKTIALLPPVQEAAARQDREVLLALLSDAFATLKSDYGVRQFQFHTPPATSMLRVHKPQKYGDDLSSFRLTVVQANQRRAVVTGPEEGVAGLGLRAVVPLFHNGNHVGTVEFGMSLGQSLFDRFKELYGLDIALFRRDKEKSGQFQVYASTLGDQSLLSSQELDMVLNNVSSG